MRVSKETFNESNDSTKINSFNPRTSSGYFPLLKFNENLYNSCQSKFSKFIKNKRNDIKLIVNNKINEHISINDYMSKTNNNISSDKLILTPIPYMSKRRIKNNIEKKDLKNFQRNVVLMRRLEYESKMREKKMKQKYKNQIPKIIHLQKIIRGYIVRKVINQVNMIKETLINFFDSIILCIRKKYYHILKRKIKKMKKKNISDDIEDNNKENTIVNHNNNFYFENNNNEANEGKVIKKDNELHYNNTNEDIEDKIIKGLKAKSKNEDFIGNIGNNEGNNKEKNKINHNTKYNHSPFIYKEKEKHDSIIENDDYIDFSNKNSKINKKIYKIVDGINEMKENNINNKDNDKEKNKNKNKNKDKKECLNKNPKNNRKSLSLSNISSFKDFKKANTEIIQRQFRKYLSKKGYYGKFDIRKMAIVYLIKNMIFCNVRPYLFNILKIYNKKIKNTIITQEENFFSITTERIINVSKVYISAKNDMK